MTLQPDQIEKIVCVPIHNAKKVAMDNDTTEMLMRLLLGSSLSIPENEKPFLYQVIEKRVQHCLTFTLSDPKLILFLALISKTPGTAMLYLWYLQYWCFKNKVVSVDLGLFCNIFPVGFPSESDLQRIWDAQKVSAQPDNLVDYEDAGKSILVLN